MTHPSLFKVTIFNKKSTEFNSWGFHFKTYGHWPGTYGYKNNENIFFYNILFNYHCNLGM